MNSLTKVLLEDILEAEKKKVTAIYGGGFKPPTKGHFNVVEKATEQNPEIDDFIIFVGGGERDGITQGESIQIWELYKKYLPLKVRIEPAKAPVGDILKYAKEHPDEEVLWVIGARENNPDDWADISSRTRTIDKYPNLELRVIQTAGGVSGTAARKAIKDNNKEQFFHLIPDIEEKEQIWDIVSPVIKEDLSFEKKRALVKKIISMARRAGDNTSLDKLADIIAKQIEVNPPHLSPGEFKVIKENATYSKDIDIIEKCAALTNYMRDLGMPIDPVPSVEFINGDTKNARDFFGKTAYYDPNEKKIVLYTEGRHPKDIVRSYAHEMIHHMQNLEGRLGDITTTNTQEDDHLNDIEAEANLKGTMTFRNWTDSLNEVGEANLKPYKWEEVDVEGYWVYTRFVTDNETQYEVDIHSTVYYPEGQMESRPALEIEFSAKPKDYDSSSTHIVVNKGEMYRVMATIVNIVKKYAKKARAQAIIYSPDKKSGEETFGNQRDKLYRAFISKAFPGTTFRQSGDFITAILPNNAALTLQENKDPFGLLKEIWKTEEESLSLPKFESKYKLGKVLKEEETDQQYKIYCDMDGVLVDFDKGYKALTGIETHHADTQGKNEFWNLFRTSLENKKMQEKDYWANLQWMPDGKELWDHIKQYKPSLLSAPSRDPQSRWGKRIWVKKNIPGTPLILAAAEAKKNYARKNAILIDDRVSNINDWNAAGGIGILHTSTASTLEKLAKYGI